MYTGSTLLLLFVFFNKNLLIYSYFSIKNIGGWYLLEAPKRSTQGWASNECLQYMSSCRTKKIRIRYPSVLKLWLVLVPAAQTQIRKKMVRPKWHRICTLAGVIRYLFVFYGFLSLYYIFSSITFDMFNITSDIFMIEEIILDFITIYLWCIS